MLISMLSLAIVLSLDAFGVGLAYGGQMIRIPMRSVAIISLATSITLFLFMVLGDALSDWVPVNLGKKAGSFILIGADRGRVLGNLASPEKEATIG